MEDKDRLMATYREDGLINIWHPGGTLVSVAVVGSESELRLYMAARGYEPTCDKALPYTYSWRRIRA